MIEADSYRFHATPEGHARDCQRYNLLVLDGWVVLRFAWEHVMNDEAYVRWVLSTCKDGQFAA